MLGWTLRKIFFLSIKILSLSQAVGVTSQIQATSDETQTVGVANGVLLPVELESASSQYIDAPAGSSCNSRLITSVGSYNLKQCGDK